jgi:predicted nucleotidyltransferase
MASSIDSYLKTLSSSFYLKKDSSEVARINTSKENLLKNLDTELGVRINRRFVFGSYDRDTILPRNIDSKSDIDVMVVFNHTDYERSPETYRAWLQNFGNKYYRDRYGSEVVKSYPTVTIRLGNIHFDLVPAKEESGIFASTLYIPDKNWGWQSTNPNDVKNKLTEVNTKYNSIVRPIIRLLKAWNCTKGYPYDSYELEQLITNMNFYGDNVQSGLFYAVGHLSSNWNDPQTKKVKITSLKYNIDEVKKALEAYDVARAKQWLHRVLPNG